MKTIVLTSLLLLATLFSAIADNWHPFPFKAAYYGRRVGIGSYDGLTGGVLPSTGPTIWGRVVEAIYLDSAYTTGGQTIRSRSQGYPYEPNGSFLGSEDLVPAIGHAYLETSADSSVIKIILQTKNSVQNVLNFNLNDVHASGSDIQIGEVFGVMDSIATVSGMYTWSKRFGITAFILGEDTLRLIGVADLHLGWQPFSATSYIPSVGDEYHYKTHKKQENIAGGPNCAPNSHSETLSERRFKVLEYPYQGDATKVRMETIVSEDGGNTGVLYTNVRTIPDSSSLWQFGVLVPSTWAGDFLQIVFHGFFISDNGFTVGYRWSYVIDGGPMASFYSCQGNLFPAVYGRYLNNWFGCTHAGTEITFPGYLHFQNACTMGVPPPPVVITSNRDLQTGKPLSGPNPVQHKWQVSLPAEQGTITGWKLLNTLGRSIQVGATLESGTLALDFSSLPVGVFMVQLETANGRKTFQVLHN